MGQSRPNATKPSVARAGWRPPDRQGRRVGGLLCKPQSLFSRPGRLGSWTHPPLDSIQEGGCCFFPLDFLEFWKPSGPGGGEGGRSRSGEECESLPRPGGPEGAGNHSCQGSGTVISECFSFVLEPCSSGKWNFCPLTSPSHLTFLLGVEGGRNSPSGPAKSGEEDYGYEAPLPPDRCWEL